MNVEYNDGTRKSFQNLTGEQVLDETKAALQDPKVARIEILPNRHERRRQAAFGKKKGK